MTSNHDDHEACFCISRMKMNHLTALYGGKVNSLGMAHEGRGSHHQGKSSGLMSVMDGQVGI